MNIQFKKGALDLCVMTMLCLRDMYGFELVSAISDDIKISEGAIYPLLKRIKEEGYVTTYLKESTDGPPRKYYSITAEGRAVKQKMESEWRAFVSGMEKILNRGIIEDDL